MKKAISIALIAALFTACKKEQSVDSAEKTLQTTPSTSITIQDSTKTDSLTVTETSNYGFEKFPLPSSLEGCSCYFAENKADFAAGKYIYVDDYGNNAQIKVNGNKVQFPMEEGDFDPSNFQKKLETSLYEINMTGKKISEMEETMMFEGEISLKNKKTNAVTKSTFYGECGC